MHFNFYLFRCRYPFHKISEARASRKGKPNVHEPLCCCLYLPSRYCRTYRAEGSKSLFGKRLLFSFPKRSCLLRLLPFTALACRGSCYFWLFPSVGYAAWGVGYVRPVQNDNRVAKILYIFKWCKCVHVAVLWYIYKWHTRHAHLLQNL